MPKAEGKKYEFSGHDAIDDGVLETLEYTGRPQTVAIESNEFSAVCPYSGLPDFGTIKIEYIPDKMIVELKSLKYYFTSFRNVGIYQEDAVNRVFSDLKKLLRPKSLKINLRYNIRGGIDVVCEMKE